MGRYITLCWRQCIYLWGGRKICWKRCIKIPLYYEIEKKWPPIPPEEIPGEVFDPIGPWKHELLNEFNGAIVGPNVRDLVTTIGVLRQLEFIENTDVRVRLQEQVGEMARALAAEALSEADFNYEVDAEERYVEAIEKRD